MIGGDGGIDCDCKVRAEGKVDFCFYEHVLIYFKQPVVQTEKGTSEQ